MGTGWKFGGEWGWMTGARQTEWWSAAEFEEGRASPASPAGGHPIYGKAAAVASGVCTGSYGEAFGEAAGEATGDAAGLATGAGVATGFGTPPALVLTAKMRLDCPECHR